MIPAVHRTGLGVFFASALAAAALNGCGVGSDAGSGLFVSTGRCLPEPLSVDPATVVVGRSVAVSSPAFRCDASYPAGKRYTLTLAFGGRMEPVELGTVAVDEDGSFRATVS